MPEFSIEQALKWARQTLTDNQVSDDGNFDSALIDSKALLCASLNCEPVYLHTWPEKHLTPPQVNIFQKMLAKRVMGHPVAHIIGYRDFWSLRLAVTPATLIPRPETELLVELALDLPLPQQAKIIDLGTGTGAIALALASEKTGWSITGIDKSQAAVELAQQNAASHHLDQVQFLQSDWFSALGEQQFNLIITNPPYIEINDHHLSKGDVRFEPDSALTSGKDGLDDIRYIVSESLKHLVTDGWLLIEHGNNQGQAVSGLLASNGFSKIRTENDLNQQPRVTLAMLK